MRAKIIAAGVIGLLCGCATQAQRQFETISANLKTADAERSSCVAAVYNSPDAAPLRVHRPLNLHDLTLEQLADSSKATDEEVSAILTTHPRFQECRRAYLAALSGSVPSLVPIYVEAYNKVDDNLLALIQQRIVWGDWLKQERDRAGATQAAVQAEGQRIGQGLNQEHQAELARRQRAADAMAQWAQTQQLINAMNRPAPTFYAMPPMTTNSLNCMSNRVGSTVFTNCN